MIEVNHLPEKYQKYSVLGVCSNSLRNGAHIMVVDGVVPVLIGSGPNPLIWIYGLEEPHSKNYVLLVEASVSQHPSVSVEQMEKQILVKVQGATILRVLQIGSNEALVTDIDLRPLGFNVYGSMTSLKVGGMTLSNNTVSGGALVGLRG